MQGKTEEAKKQDLVGSNKIEETKDSTLKITEDYVLTPEEVGSDVYKFLKPYFEKPQSLSLTTLDLSCKKIGPKGAIAIAKNTRDR